VIIQYEKSMITVKIILKEGSFRKIPADNESKRNSLAIRV